MRGPVRAALAFVAVAAVAAFVASQGCDEVPETPDRGDLPAAAGAASGPTAGSASVPATKRAPRSAPVAADAGSEFLAPDVGARIVRGRVVDEEARTPIAGACAQVWISVRRRGGTTSVLADDVDGDLFGPAVVSDADGRFEAAFPEDGRHRVLVTHPGYASVVEHADPGDDDVEAVLQRLVATPFRVVDRGGTPVAGAEIRCGRDEEAPAFEVVRTGADGRATVRTVPGSRVVVRATDFATALAGDGPSRGEHVVVLDRGLPVAGRVEDARGRPLSGASVRMHREEELRDEVTTDEQGRFAFDGVGAHSRESYRIEVYLRGSGDAEAEVVPGDLDVRVVLRRWGRVRGEVVDREGRRIPGASLGHMATGSEGKFELRLESGPQTLEARMRLPEIQGAYLAGTASVDVPADGMVEDVRIVVGPHSGQSFLEIEWEGSQIVERDWFQIAVSGGGLREPWTAFSGQAPGVVVLPLPPGTAVTVSGGVGGRPEAGFATVEGVVTAASPRGTRVKLRLAPAPRVRVRVTDAAGERSDLLKDLVVASGRAVSERTADGTWAIDPAVPVTISLARGDPVAGTVTFDPPHPLLRDVDLRFVPGTTVDARIVGNDGKPAFVGGKAYLSAPPATWTRECEVGRDGGILFRDVAPGAAILQAGPEDGDDFFRWTVEVPAVPVADLGGLALVEAQWFEGRVTDGEARGLGGALVTVHTPEDSDLDVTTWSAPDGSFRARFRPMAGLVFRVRKRGFRDARVPVPGAGAETVVRLSGE